jgi:hypothetical protein
MDPFASEKFINCDLEKISSRAARENWSISQHGIYVKCLLNHKTSGEKFSLFLNCEGYPRNPIKAAFLPLAPVLYPASKWPYDNDYVFRTGSPSPFICLPGLSTYIPEKEQGDHPYSLKDINVGTVITRIYQAINSDKYKGIIAREVRLI